MTERLTLRELIGDVVRQIFPQVANPWGPYEYRVSKIDGARLTLAAVRPGAAPEPRVDVWGGIPGGAGVPTIGSSVVLFFLDGDPAKPVVVAFHPLRLTGGVPTSATLDGAAVKVGPSATSVQVGTSSSEVDAGAAEGLAVREGDVYSLGLATGPLTWVSSPTVHGRTKVKV